MAQTKVKLISDGVIDVNHLASGHSITTDNIGEGSNLYYTDARVSTYLSTNNYATEGYVTTAVANLVDSAPTTLDTLNELAAALGDDPNFATTVTNSIATKLPLAGGSITGTLGIGTASVLSGNKLDVRGGNIMVGGYGTGVDYGLIFTPADSSSYWHIYNDTSGALAFGRHATIGSSEHLRIDSSGNVGVSIISPRSKLDINGIITQEYGNVYQVKQGATEKYYYSNGASYNAFGTGVLGIGTTGDAIQFATSNSVRATINSSGNIGIGTTTPGTNLISIRGYGAIDSNANQGLTLESNHYYDSGSKYRNNGYASIISQDTGGTYAGYIRFQQAGLNSSGAGAAMTLSDSMVIDESGNVGIGTTTPISDAKLVVKDGNTYLEFSCDNAVANTARLLSYDRANSLFRDLQLRGANVTINNGDSEVLRVNSSGYVGIGTTSINAPLHVYGKNQTNGTVELTPNIAKGGYASYVHYGTSGDWYIRSANASGKIILQDTGGNVGIGTSSPVNILDVNGTIRSTGGISTDNSAKSYIWTLHNTGNSGTVWKRIARFTAGQSDRIKITLTGEAGYSNGASFGAMATILAQFNNANNLQGRFSREGSNQPIYGVNFEQISGTDYYINVQVGSYSEFAIEAAISGGTLTPITASSTAGISANVAEEKRIHSPTYFLNNNVGINTTSPQAKLDVNGATRVRNNGASVYTSTKYYSLPLNNSVNVSVDINSEFGIGTSGYVLVEVTVSTYGTAGVGGGVFKYIAGGYSGHTISSGGYHQYQVIANSVYGSISYTVYNPSASVYGVQVNNSNSTYGGAGVMEIRVTSNY